MKKLFLSLCAVLVLTASAFSIDFEKAEKAIREYSWTKQTTYIAVLVDYGFTEEQVKSWRITGVFIGNYIGQLQGILNGYGVANQEMALMSIRNNAGKELSADDLAKVEQFIKDITAVAIQLRDNAQAAKAKKDMEIAENLARKREEDRRLEEEKDRAREEERRKEDERKQLIARQHVESLNRYAASFGLSGYSEGILYSQANLNFDDYKATLIIPNDFDRDYTVKNIIGQYVIYSLVSRGKSYRVAVLAEKGKIYPAESRLDISSVYKVVGVERFNQVFLGGTVDILVLQRLETVR